MDSHGSFFELILRQLSKTTQARFFRERGLGEYPETFHGVAHGIVAIANICLPVLIPKNSMYARNPVVLVKKITENSKGTTEQ